MTKHMVTLIGVGLLASTTLTWGSDEGQVNLLSLQQGCLPVVVPPSYGGWEAEQMLDDSPSSGWASEQGTTTKNVFVFELVTPGIIERLVFDTAGIDAEGSGAKEILVEVSNDSATSGFAPILQATLRPTQDEQAFPVSDKQAARWVRLTIVNNYGNPDYSELFSFQGFGRPVDRGTTATIAGTYATDYSDFHVKQEGTTLSGCYDYDGGLLDGAIDGRLMKITWHESGGPDDQGPAVMVFADDGQSFRGYWWDQGQENGPPGGIWNGRKTSDTVGGCPHWSGSVGGELKRQLASDGRARLYGVRFAVNSAEIEHDSLPVLADVVALLQEDRAIALSIEGHTDSIGSAERNQTLSEARAQSVQAYLVSNGIEEQRLSAAGFGQTVPIADNATELGRAQNRRVELVNRQP